MNFNEFWNKEADLNWEASKDPKETARRIAEKAFHKATQQERNRCINAVSMVQEDGDIPEHTYAQATESHETFCGAVVAMIQLTKEAAIAAIKTHHKTKH